MTIKKTMRPKFRKSAGSGTKPPAPSKRAALYSQCKALANSPDILAALSSTLRERGIVGDLQNFLIVYLAVITRLFDHPTSVVLKGVSSAGKSAVPDAVLSLCPPSAFHVLTSMSDRALFYSSESFEHRMIVIHEAAGLSEQVLHSMRVLQSQGYITREITVSKPGGFRETITLTKKGPIGLITTTTAAQLHAENETRLLSLTVPDSEEQTNAIMLAMTGEAKKHSIPHDWHALHEWVAMGPTEVTIPFDRIMAGNTRGIVPRMSRDFQNMKSLVSAHALLHQESRKRKSGKIVAKISDYRAVWKLVGEIISVGVEATVAPETRETVEAVCRLRAGGQTVALPDLAKELHRHTSTVSRRVARAIKLGYLRNLETSCGIDANIVVGKPLPEDVKIFPTPNEVLRLFKAQKKAAQRSTTKKTIGRKPGSR